MWYRVTDDDELEIIWKEVAGGIIEILPWNLP
jgi:hypothetical protein